MSILVIVGLAVVVLGALILLRLPDRPGGRIAWQGMEVSSVGAGLPLIVVGIAAVAIGGGTSIGGDHDGKGGGSPTTGTETRADGNTCLDELSSSVARGRVKSLESGAVGQPIVGSFGSKSEPFALRLTDNGGEPVGAMVVRWFPQSGVFKALSFVDADCKRSQVEDVTTGEGPLEAIPNNADVRLDLMGTAYVFNLGSSTEIRANFGRFTP